jgi:secreted Zn-dependent insulinase-like peptidase
VHQAAAPGPASPSALATPRPPPFPPPPKVDPERFAAVREALAKEYSNVRYGQPYHWAMYRLDMLLNYRRWRVEQYEAVVGSAAAAGPGALAAHLPRLMGRMFTEAMVVGNADEVRGLGGLQDLLARLPSPPDGQL